MSPLSFPLNGLFFGDRKEVIARVDETEILQRDFQRMYGQQLESLRQRLGENADQIAQQVNCDSRYSSN